MPVSVTMPQLGESVTEGTVTRWLKQEGDRVEADEPLLEVSTDKVDTEIPAPAAGVVSRIVVREDETADVGSELAVITGDDESTGTTPASDANRGAANAGTAPAAPAQPAPAQPQPTAQQPALAQPTAQPQPAAQPQPTAQTQSAAQLQQPATSVTMPALGESVVEGTVTRWLKSVGDRVEADEPLLEVSTDKVDTEIPAPATGVILEIKVAQDETVPVGSELAVIGSPAESQAQPPTPEPTPTPAPALEPTPAAEPAPAPRPRRRCEHSRRHRPRLRPQPRPRSLGRTAGR